ncbi:MAG: chemotaxis protein CheB [Gorillibacterium sp.]|nr:chemotaxis protein CheB [Gorillibacterium sp.]
MRCSDCSTVPSPKPVNKNAEEENRVQQIGTKPTPSNKSSPTSALPFQHVVVIGTSTGGPRALQKVLLALSKGFSAPVLIVQHMPPKFTRSLAERLDSMAEIKIVEAVDGMKVEKGVAYIAPGGFHMTMERDKTYGYQIKVSGGDLRSGHRPSVDVLFESMVPLNELKRHVVLMTGMGSDGAKGMQALVNAGAVTAIAEAEETCVVYGMPRAAVLLQCVTHMLPLHDIPVKLMQLIEVNNN